MFDAGLLYLKPSKFKAFKIKKSGHQMMPGLL